jgi:hypothetical protein
MAGLYGGICHLRLQVDPVPPAALFSYALVLLWLFPLSRSPWVTAQLSSCSASYSVAGMPSFAFWTGQPLPTTLNNTDVLVISPARQADLVHDLCACQTSALFIIQPDCAKPRCESSQDRAAIFAIFSLSSIVGRKNSAALDVPRSFRTVCNVFETFSIVGRS